MPLPAASESSIVLEIPGELEGLLATTFDEDGHAVGTSSFEVESEDTGRRRLRVRMAIDGGGQNLSEVTIAPIIDALAANLSLPDPANPSDASNAPLADPAVARPQRYHIVEERVQSTRADGTSLDYLVIDHARGQVSCYPPDRDLSKGEHLELPDGESVVNVPMQLLFQPLVHGEVDRLRFQIAVCRSGPALHDVVAVRGPKTHHDGRDVIEIRYGPDLGNAVAWLASRLLPRFSFWFDLRDGGYLGHRMPLHRKGPEILLVRKGLTPVDLGAD
jgi:hypothetical protein